MSAKSPIFCIPSNADHERISALFLGPKAENFGILKECFVHVLDKQRAVRVAYHPEDKPYITADIKSSEAYNHKKKKLISTLDELTDLLNRHSIPFFSPRYSAHMCCDMSMPAILGYISTMLFNPNNVAFEASPITTHLELIVGQQLCEMFGYNINKAITSRPLGWGHITCDGTVANLESLWAARNLKFYALALRDAMVPGKELEFIADKFKIKTCVGDEKLLRDLTTWELLNLRVPSVLDVPQRLYDEFAISTSFLDSVMKKYSIQSVSKDDLERRWNIEKTPQFFIANTKHYSWPKSAAIAGIGSTNAIDVPVDIHARINLTRLREMLDDRLRDERAIYSVVAVMGTTEEGAVDPLGEILDLRDEYAQKGLSFVVHADAAWGGYFASMIPNDLPDGGMSRTRPGRSYVPQVGLRKETELQLRRLQDADSITVDPHKSGYVPYPAGGLCYRDGRMRYLLTWTAPYINQGVGESIGVYGVEGSKPGASAAAVWLAHEVIGLTEQGHGALLGEASFTCRRFASHWAAMSTDETSYIVVPLNPLPSELADNSTKKSVDEEKEFIRKRILGVENLKLVQDSDAMKILNQLGSDLNINAFACNFRYPDGRVNTDIREANYLNQRIFERLSVTSAGEDPLSVPFYLTSTTFKDEEYTECVRYFKKRLGLEGDQDLFVLRNVVMSPFSTEGNFVPKLVDIFRDVLEEEIKAVIERNTPQPGIHSFVMQGTDKLYLVHMPAFHMAAGRYQFIFSADLSGDMLKRYRGMKEAFPDSILILRNTKPALLDDLIDGGTFEATISVDGAPQPLGIVDVQNISIIRKRSLDAEDMDASYPKTFMPFYIYGTSEQQHIDHVLVMAPNAQFSAAQVQLNLGKHLSAETLAKGVLLYLTDIRELSMQPFPPMKDLHREGMDKFFFRPGRQFSVSVYRDPFPAISEDCINLLDVTEKELITKGTVTLGPGVYIDTDKLNYEVHEEQVDVVTFRNHPGGHMSGKAKQTWAGAVDKQFYPS